MKKDNPEEEFTSRLLSGLVKHLSEYDELFFSINGNIYRKAKAVICRLEYPLELMDEYKEGYLNFLQKSATLLIPLLIKNKDVDFISVLAGIGVIPLETISEYIDLANESSQTEILAILMDYRNKNLRNIPPLNFELDLNKPIEDWATTKNEDGTLTITQYRGKDQAVMIPSTINGKKVKCIEGNIYSLK